jgi:hypothetical protein
MADYELVKSSGNILVTFPSDRDIKFSIDTEHWFELRVTNEALLKLEQQLAAATARIKDLESENANKRHVDELLFKANARIAELEKARSRRFVMPKFEEGER